MTATGSFRRWERFMFIFVGVNFLAIPLVILVHPHAGPIVHGFLVPGAQGGMTSTAVLLIIAIVGTTVAPWQLFFQQSNIVDKRITPRWINYERADTVIGSLVVVIAATALVVTAAFAFRAHTVSRATSPTREGVARGLDRYVGHGTGPLFALVLLNASIIGAAAVTLSTSYAVGDIFGIRHSLHRSFADAKPFYVMFSALVILAAAHRADPARAARAHHDLGAGAGRRAASERNRLPAAALQRQGGARAVGQPPVAQRPGRVRSSPCCSRSRSS